MARLGLLPRDVFKSWPFRQQQRMVIRNGLQTCWEGVIVNPGLYAERRKMSFMDRLYGSKLDATADGFPNQQQARRTGRVVALGLRGHPRLKAMMIAIRKRDNVPSLVVLLELAIEAYLQVHHSNDNLDMPSDEEIITKYEREQDKRNSLEWKKRKTRLKDPQHGD